MDRPKYMITNIRDANRDGITVQVLFPDNNKRTLKLSADRLAELADREAYEASKDKPTEKDREACLNLHFEVQCMEEDFRRKRHYIVSHMGVDVVPLEEDVHILETGPVNSLGRRLVPTPQLAYVWERGKKIPPSVDQTEEGEKK